MRLTQLGTGQPVALGEPLPLSASQFPLVHNTRSCGLGSLLNILTANLSQKYILHQSQSNTQKLIFQI